MKTVQHSVAKSTHKQQLQATSADKEVMGVGLVMQSTQSPSRKEKRNISRATQQPKYWEQTMTKKIIENISGIHSGLRCEEGLRDSLANTVYTQAGKSNQ